MWLNEAKLTQSRLNGMDLDSDDEEVQEDVKKETVWLDHIIARRNDLDEELLNLQGVQTRADVVELDHRRKE
jgi:hypothetical protein